MRRRIWIYAVAIAAISCSAAEVTRAVKNINLDRKGIHLRLRYIPAGMHRDPLVIQFSEYLHKISGGKVMVHAYNVYTVGDFTKAEAGTLPGVSNFLDPNSKFKDAWFGVYLILDDDRTYGRRFMLRDPHGRPDAIENLNDDAVLLLPALDQKIIVWSSHQGHAGYTMDHLNKEFHFTPCQGRPLKRGIIEDGQGRVWRTITGSFDTIAALTDTSKTSMGLFSSIRNYVGLPSAAVYESVTPWHPVVISGRVWARYFPCGLEAFWAVVYCNGSSFTTRNGEERDTWQRTDLQTIFEKMFNELEIDCAQR